MKNVNTITRISCLFVLALCSSLSMQAQLNGSYTIGGSNPDYSTLSAAISDLNTNGVNGPVEFLIRDGSYSGNSWRGSIGNVAGASNTNRITFRSQSGKRSDVVLKNSSSANYIFRFNNAKYITVKDMTLQKTSSSYCRVFDFGSSTASEDSIINCEIKAEKTKSSSTARALVYANDHTGSNNVFMGCDFVNGGTQIYWQGDGTSRPSQGLSAINCSFTGNNSVYRATYVRYVDNVHFIGNEFLRTGTGTYYGGYFYYCDKNLLFLDNELDIEASSTIYGLYTYRTNFISKNKSPQTRPRISNNVINIEGGSGRLYTTYCRYDYHTLYSNNDITAVNTTGYQYTYGLYNCFESVCENNTYDLTKTSSSRSMYFYGSYNSANYVDTFRNNSVTIKRPNGGTIYNYMIYYGKGVMIDNQFDVSNKNSTTYNYIRYPENCVFAHNTLKSTSNRGTIYGLYDYSTSSRYPGGDIMYNDFEFESNSGTVYGVYPYRSKSRYRSNVVTTKTSGSNYTFYPRYCYGSKFYNNTFYSLATGNTNYVARIYNTSSSYSSEFYNNVFSKSSSKGYTVYAYDKDYFEADYNIYDGPSGSTIFYSRSPSYQGNKLQTWRDKTGSDMNSLVYKVPFVDAQNRDFHIDANDPAAWAVNGRGMHDTMNKEDIAGTTRPIFPQDGVPDLGAYEVTPSSTPPDVEAAPPAPVANSMQVFTFGQDTVGTIAWGATVPNTISMRQYTGVQAAPMPAGVGRMYFYTAVTPSSWVHPHTARMHYKDPWIGDIPTESEAVIARSSNGGAWEGYNYTNAATNTTRNVLAPAYPLDSVGGYTGVQNGRIGIRCVKDPEGITISNITAFEADIDWNPVFNPIGYQVVFKKIEEAPSQAEWDNAAFPTSNSLAANGLEEDTKYYVYVRSVCGVKDTSGYSVDSFSTIITCHTPEIGIANLSDTRAVIYWDDIKTAEKYEYALTTSQTPPANGTDLNKTSVLATFLDPDKQYYAHVRAHCNTIYEESDWGRADFKTWPLGVGNVSGNENGLAVYPNPVSDNMMVTVGGTINGAANITIMDMTGKLLKTITATGNKTSISVNELPSGMYILKYTDEISSKQVKFSKQ